MTKNAISLVRSKNIQFLIFGMGIATCYYFIRVYAQVDSRGMAVGVASELILLGLIISITVRGIKLRILEDAVTFSAMGVGVFSHILSEFVDSRYGILEILKTAGISIAGLILGAGSLYLLGCIQNFIYKKDSVEVGDVKLAAAMGAFVGPFVIIFVPLWLTILFICSFIMKIRKIMTGQMIYSIPTVPVHFITLIFLLSIERGVLDLIGVMINFAVLCLGCNSFMGTIKEKDGLLIVNKPGGTISM